ncbi:MAG: DUF819 domain-containing protein [Gemmatimonadota bacterium]
MMIQLPQLSPLQIQDPLALAATVAGATALAFWLDRRFRWAEKIGATLLVIIFGALLSNLGLVPPASPVYDAITGPITSLAIVWLLFAVDLRDLKEAGPRMLGAFGIAVGATAVGAIVATFLFGAAFGGEAWKLAGVMTGTYGGGSLNFVAVGRELDLPAALFTAATAADNVVTAIWIGATLVLPVWLARYYPTPVPTAAPVGGRTPRVPAGGAEETTPGDPPVIGAGRAGGAGERGPARAFDGAALDSSAAPAEPAGPSPSDDPDADHPIYGTAALRVIDVSLLLGLGLLLLLLSDAIGELTPAIPSVLWLTTLALAVAQLSFVRRLAGAMQLGTLALHLFFVVIGIGSRIAEIASVGIEIFYLTATVVLIHGALLYGVARVVRLDLGTTSVASQAAVGGPSTALALAVARDWRALVLPGTIAGLLGYAVGNYAGFGVAYLMRAVLGG